MRAGSILRHILTAAMCTFGAALCILGGAEPPRADETTAADRPLVLVAAIEGPIGPATAHHVEDVIARAEERDAALLVLRINTPGGLATSMREVIEAIMGASVPIAGFVAPPGAHAASAGTYILYSSPIAAMAPGTNVGAATPVQIGGLPNMPEPGDKPTVDAPGEGENGREAGGADDPPLAGSDAMTAKATNDAVAFIRSLAEVYGRNAEWAEKAVREAASLSASEALEQGVIDVLAADVADLLAQIDGREVPMGKTVRTLSLEGATVETLEPGTVTKVLAILSNPNVAFVLMLVGVYGIIFEFLNPGALAPGVIGSVALVLGLFALNQLPLDYAGLALLILGIAFMVGEAITPTFGILGFGGVVAFVIGSAMLIDTDIAAYQLSWWMIGAMTAISAAVLVLLIGATWRSYRTAPETGPSLVIGAEAEVLDWSGDKGHVWAQSERWSAVGARGLSPGAAVKVEGVDGLTLIVAPDDGAGPTTHHDREKA